MSDIQEEINVFTANLHPLILFLGIMEGFSGNRESALQAGFKVSFVSMCTFAYLHIVYMFSLYTRCCFCVGWVGIRKGVITVDCFDKLVRQV